MTSTDPHAHTYDIPAIDSYGNHIIIRLSCIGPAIVTVEFLTANSARLAEYHVSITNTGAMLRGLSTCDRRARMWPDQAEQTEPLPEPPDGDTI